MRLLVLWIAATLAACTQMPPRDGGGSALFDDALFATPQEPVDPAEIFAVSAEMRDYAAALLARAPGHPRRALKIALRDDIRIDYEGSVTRNAAQTFAGRSGNCLSLVVMTAALAGQLGLSTTFQEVRGHEVWTRSNGIAFHAGHVNIVVLGRDRIVEVDADAEPDLVVDFMPPASARRLRAVPISTETVVAMYLNNRGAEALAAGDIPGAYAWIRAAARSEPGFLPPYNTLAVVYLRRGVPAHAEQALRYVLEHEPGNVEALSNLILALQRQGRSADADGVRRRLAAVQAVPPFHYLDEGLAALRRGDDASAVRLLGQELRRMPYDDEVHFAMGVAYLRLGDLRRGRAHLALAEKHSPLQSRRAIYAAKLQSLAMPEVR